MTLARFTLSFAVAALAVCAQDNPVPEKWNVYFQATSIGQYHPGFSALYSGPFSLANHPEAEVSLTSTVFLGLRLAKNTQFYVNPEVAGGRAFSGTNGVADFPNGEMPRVSTATPKPYLARLYVTQDFAISDETEDTESDANQLAGRRPATRYSITVGRFTVTDFFDNNRYSHDPRTQFMSWGIMYNGAWDYPADTRGYTWGWMHEFHTRRWSLRYASAAMPKVANGLRFDRRLFRDRADMAEGEIDGKWRGHEGAIRFLGYANHYHGGSYADAVRMAETAHTRPDITANPQTGATKYGFGISADQEVARDVGLFGRLGWNDGKNQSFAFTAIDRLAEVGVSVKGSRWKRPEDTAATVIAIGGLSSIHAEYLRRGGVDFLIGDGTLRYGRETISESYYSARVAPGVFATLGLERLYNPAYNRDRGPVWIGTFRVHIEAGKK